MNKYNEIRTAIFITCEKIERMVLTYNKSRLKLMEEHIYSHYKYIFICLTNFLKSYNEFYKSQHIGIFKIDKLYKYIYKHNLHYKSDLRDKNKILEYFGTIKNIMKEEIEYLSKVVKFKDYKVVELDEEK